MNQTTNTVVMVRPADFRNNEQTAVNNFYQTSVASQSPDALTIKAKEEFDEFVVKLKAAGVNVIVVQDTEEFDTPDAVFPNNWISFHYDGTIALYPMFAENRRLERNEELLFAVEKNGFRITDVVDYTDAENEAVFLEGTGSMVLDRVNRKAYCALSPRANEELFIEFCEDFEYTPVLFKAYQNVSGNRQLIYHTNVMMCIAETFAIICLDAIDDKKERKNVIKHLKENGKELITITEQQVAQFAGNMLQVSGVENKKYLVMSETAHKALTQDQVNKIKTHCVIISSNLNTIEVHGGGSARCMMAEVFLPKS